MWRKFTTIVLIILFIAMPFGGRSSLCFATPVALTPAVKYAIAAAIAAGGVYASNQDSLDYIVSDYWSKASNEVKSQWGVVVNYGLSTGSIVLSGSLQNSLGSYISSNYSDGSNNVTATVSTMEGTFKTVIKDHFGGDSVNFDYPISFGFVGKDFDVSLVYNGMNMYGAGIYDLCIYLNGQLDYVVQIQGKRDGTYPYIVFGTKSTWGEGYISCVYWTGEYDYLTSFSLSERYFGGAFPWNYAFSLGITGVLGSYVGDGVGYPYAVSKVSAPPVPEVDWPDYWFPQLGRNLTLEGNPDLSKEYVADEEYEFYYIDSNGDIVMAPKGSPSPSGGRKLIPGLPIPIPSDYPTYENPDITETLNPPTSQTVNNPDGTSTETITQTRDITKTWYNPDTGRWHTEKTTETTTTTIQRDSTGTETGRDVVTVPSPGPNTSQPGTPDDTSIDWEPLRKSIGALTNKFPFSLPWDLMRGVESLQGSEWDRKFIINIGDGIWPAMTIDLSMFDGIAGISRIVMLVIFDFGLIFATRKLMGGDV